MRWNQTCVASPCFLFTVRADSADNLCRGYVCRTYRRHVSTATRQTHTHFPCPRRISSSAVHTAPHHEMEWMRHHTSHTPWPTTSPSANCHGCRYESRGTCTTLLPSLTRPVRLTRQCRFHNTDGGCGGFDNARSGTLELHRNGLG